MNTEVNLKDQHRKRNFDFVDTIRCIAMIGIVMEHCVYNGTYIFDGFPPKHILYMSLIQFPKFGTIAFFILAGFLLGDKFTNYSSWQYFKRRLNTVFLPWLIWSMVFLVAILIQQYIALNKTGDFHIWDQLKSKVELIYLYTNYWFMINFLFCIGILLCLKKYLYSFWLGAVFLILSLIYSANIYFTWFLPSHTIAIFGFIFYLWLGAMLNRYWEKVNVFTSKVPNVIFFSFFVISFFIAVFEIKYLVTIKSVDPYNTLRISNIIYSLICIFVLFKVREFTFVKHLKPSETTFGVYLIHYILVANLLPEIFRPFHLAPIQNMSVAAMILFVLFRLIIVYGTTMAIIFAINKTKFRWLIGK